MRELDWVDLGGGEATSVLGFSDEGGCVDSTQSFSLSLRFLDSSEYFWQRVPFGWHLELSENKDERETAVAEDCLPCTDNELNLNFC